MTTLDTYKLCEATRPGHLAIATMAAVCVKRYYRQREALMSVRGGGIALMTFTTATNNHYLQCMESNFHNFQLNAIIIRANVHFIQITIKHSVYMARRPTP